MTNVLFGTSIYSHQKNTADEEKTAAVASEGEAGPVGELHPFYLELMSAPAVNREGPPVRLHWAHAQYTYVCVCVCTGVRACI